MISSEFGFIDLNSVGIVSIGKKSMETNSIDLKSIKLNIIEGMFVEFVPSK